MNELRQTEYRAGLRACGVVIATPVGQHASPCAVIDDRMANHRAVHRTLVNAGQPCSLALSKLSLSELVKQLAMQVARKGWCSAWAKKP